MSENKKTIAIIGSGRLANALAKAFHKKDFIIGIISTNQTTGKELAQTIQSDYHAQFPNDLNPDFIFLCVPDSAIEQVSQRLPKNPQQTILHCSGATDMKVLQNHSSYGVFYPLQSFSFNENIDFQHIPIFLEGNNSNTLQVIENLAKSISQTTRVIQSQDRLKYHLSAVIANNFTNHLIALMQDYCTQENLDKDLLKPILETTFQKLLHSNAKEIQTGPAIRYDIPTLEKHFALLQENEGLLKVYKVLSESIKAL